MEKLSRFFKDHQENIYQLIRERLQQRPLTPYKSFISEHPEGQKRSHAFVRAFQEALDGRLEVLFEDQRQIGYKRAVEGYDLEDMFTYKMAFTDVMWSLINSNNVSQDESGLISFNDIKAINHLINYSNFLLSDSFLRTRDEIIQHRRNQLQELHRYAASAVSMFKREELRSCARQGIFNIFGLEGSYIAPIAGHDDDSKEGRLASGQLPPGFIEAIELRVKQTSKAMAIDVSGAMIGFDEETQQERFQTVCIPIHTTNSDATVLFIVHDKGRVFKLQRFDKNLLYQFVYFTGALLSNSLMVSELAGKKEELHELTGKLISVQEEEKKKIGADIHDTITQALTAIGYKALVCQALVNKDLPRLEQELNRLVHDINGALKKARSIISELRPKILDDLGIVTALHQAISCFKEDSGLAVSFDCPETLNIHPDIGIALYRICQEALRNIRKHARASQVDISLNTIRQNWLSLKIRDNGRGMVTDPAPKSKSHSGIGLLTMRERAEKAGGQFVIESKDMNGCQITVTVPLKL
ncbi:sensor histidine kinase [bacterium]|nr:sensor histidine kinase [bacterium]